MRTGVGMILALLLGIVIAIPINQARGDDPHEADEPPWVGTWHAPTHDTTYLFAADGGAIMVDGDEVLLGRWEYYEDHARYVFERWDAYGVSGPVGVDPDGNVVGPGGVLEEMAIPPL